MPASPARSPEIKSGERLAFLSTNARPFRFAHNRGRRPAETTGVALPWRWAIAYLHRTFHSHDANCFFDTISKLNYPPAMPEHLSHVMRKNAGLLAKGEGEDHRWRGGGARHRGMACNLRVSVAVGRIITAAGDVHGTLFYSRANVRNFVLPRRTTDTQARVNP